MLYCATNRFLLVVVFISAISTFVVADDIPIFPNIPDGCKLSPSYFLEDCAKVLSSSQGPFFSYECVTSGGKFAYTCCDHLEGEAFAFSMEDSLLLVPMYHFFTCQHKFGRRQMEADESVGVADNADSNMEAADVGVADKADIPDFPNVPGGCQFLKSGGVSDDDCNKVMPMTGPFLSYDCEVGYTCCLQDEGETFLVWFSDPSDLHTCRRNAGRRHMEADGVGVDDDVWLSESEESSSAGVSVIAAAVLTGALAALL